MDLADLELTRMAPAAMAAVARVGAVLAVAPPFAAAGVPRRVRALLAIALAVGIVPALPASVTLPASTGQLVMAIVGEIVIGLAMGLAVSLVFAAATWAGGLIASQMGLNLAETYDPAGSGAGGAGGGSSLSHAYWLLAVVVFLAGNGHHALIRGLRASFDTVPALAAAQGEAILATLVGLTQSATVLALHLAAPVMLATLVADLALGMVGRTIPQLGVMTAAITIRAATGLFILIAAMAISAAALQGATLNWTQLVQASFGSIGR